VVPEFLQEEASPENLAQALENWLDAKAMRERLRERFADLHRSLACDHDARVADALQPYLDEGMRHDAPESRAAAVRG
jgi:lipid-A-disaccharide synthase